MPALTDLTAVRDLLNRDRAWAAYAIGDLSPGLVDHCEWLAPADRSAVLLVFRGFEPPIVFAMGAAGDLPPLFDEISAGEISPHLQRDAFEAMSAVYAPTFERRMRRMVLRPDRLPAARDEDTAPIGEGDLAAVVALYEDGRRSGEAPTFFSPAMLRQGSFRGVWEDGALVSVAGTHLFSPQLGVCAIGNVYTRRDRRGRGLGAQVTRAVARHAIDCRVPTIVLNVGQNNAVAQRVYERLGFQYHCDFVEGAATRIRPRPCNTPGA